MEKCRKSKLKVKQNFLSMMLKDQKSLSAKRKWKYQQLMWIFPRKKITTLRQPSLKANNL